MKKFLLLLISHGLVGFIGFALGIYLLPILTAPPAPSMEEVKLASKEASYQGEFRRDLKDSDALHWGEGVVHVGTDTISLEGAIAPGPAYNLYLSPEFIETEAEFVPLKSQMALVGDVKTFENFIVKVPASVDVSAYNTVVIWCESFDQFITAAQYQ